MEEIYNGWLNARDDEKRYLMGWLYANTQLFNPTIEGLSAYRAYRSLTEKKRMEYALFSSHLYDLFFSLSDEELGIVERTLPPYPYIAEMIWRNRNVTDEERKILSETTPRNPFKARRLLDQKRRILEKYGLISEEYASILERQREADWKDFRKIMALFYFATAGEIYLSTHDPIAPFLYLVSFPVPYQALRYISFKLPNRRIRSYIEKASSIYLVARSPMGMALSTLEFGLLVPIISRAIERYWDSLPYTLKWLIYNTQIFLSGLRVERFDEEKIREQLCNIDIYSPAIPKSSIERFKQEVKSGLIEIEDPRRVLLHPWALSWYRRRVVAVLDGNEIKIVDEQFIRKLAQSRGEPEEKIKEEIRRYPRQYLGIDVWKGRLAYTRDVIGVLPCQLLPALAFKEGYTAILGKKADEIMSRLDGYIN